MNNTEQVQKIMGLNWQIPDDLFLKSTNELVVVASPCNNLENLGKQYIESGIISDFSDCFLH